MLPRPDQQHRLLLAFVAASACLQLRPASAKMVMGIASGDDYQLVSTFCFTFPEPSSAGTAVTNGHIHSQTIVSSNGHKFLVLNHTDLLEGRSCDELVKRAKVIEPLSEKTKEVIAYDLTLNVEPSMNRQHIAAVIARCGQPVNAEYIVEFTNPGGYMDRHFACEDRGLLSAYFWLSMGAAGMTPAIATAVRALHRRQAHNDVSAIFFTGAAFFVTRVWLFSLHLLVYAKNGMGLGMLLFLAQFLDFLCNTMATIVLLALVHGVYVTRPAVPPGSEERRVLLQVTGGFAATYLLSTLACGFRVDGLLSPFGVVRGLASWPYLLARVCTGVFCFNKSMRHATETEALTKKNYVLRFGAIALAWLVIMPLTICLTGTDSWHSDCLIVDLSNFALFSIMLYDFWPSRFGALFGCVRPTERTHQYSEFGLDG